MDGATREAGTDIGIVWAVASQRMPGEAVLGDSFVVQEHAQGVLLATIDGLGHGPEAARAAELAAALLRQFAHESVELLVRRCHEQLTGTRGVVLNVASVRTIDGSTTWLGVGDVSTVVLRADREDRKQPFLRSAPGVVGYRLPNLSPATFTLHPQDMLVIVTDGVAPGFETGLVPLGTPRAIADRILAKSHKGTDDALVLVAQFRGP